MGEKPKKKKILWRQYISVLFFMLIGVVCGVVFITYIDAAFARELQLWEAILSFCGLLLVVYFAIFIQTIIHETGHFIFGKLSGYTFSSFRIMSFMWVRENDKLRFRRLRLAGTGGQCLMMPPEMKDGRIPVALYNLGGSMMNIFASLIFLGLYSLTTAIPFFSVSMLLLAIVGFAFAVMNGVPMRLGTVDNDGYNAFSLGRNRAAMRTFWVQLKTNEQITRGIRLKDMSEDWFTVPTDEEMKNSMVAVMGVFACNRLIDEHRFEDADRLMVHLLEIDSAMVGLHSNLMICDRLFCELIGENRRDIAEAMLTKEQKKFMKSMKKFPAVLRTQYAYALLAEKDESKADNVEVQFDKCAKSYPYTSDIQSERELMGIAKNKANTP